MADDRPTRAVAIRKHCMECNGTKVFDISSDCVDPSCDLYPFRPGDGPGHIRKAGKYYPRKGGGEGDDV